MYIVHVRYLRLAFHNFR